MNVAAVNSPASIPKPTPMGHPRRKSAASVAGSGVRSPAKTRNRASSPRRTTTPSATVITVIVSAELQPVPTIPSAGAPSFPNIST